MFTEFKHTLRRLRGSMIGWSIGLALYGVMGVSLYSSVVNIDGLQSLLRSYPREMIAFFGMLADINTPKGYLDYFYFNYMPVIVGIFSVGVGANLLVGHEEQGILDLILAQPVSRSALFWGRLLGVVVATAIILLVGWLSWLLPSQASGLDLSWMALLRPFVPLWAVLLLLSTLALLLSLVLPSARFASMLCGALLVGNYLLVGLANIDVRLESVVKLTPLHYVQGGGAITGLRWGWLAGLLGVGLAFAVTAWALFQRRDIRVGGERSWRLPGAGWLTRKRPQSA